MFCRLESISGSIKIHFETESKKEPLKRMHKAKEEYKEDFKLFIKSASYEPFVEVASTKLYPEEIVYGKSICSADGNSKRNGDKIRPAPRKRKKTLKKE